METTTSLLGIMSKWQNLKPVLSAVGVVAATGSLFIGYHIADISVNNINLNIQNLERYKLGYSSYLELPPALHTLDRHEYTPGDQSYITGSIWRKLFPKKGPKHWALVARNSETPSRSLAIEILSRLHDLPDGVIYRAALACDHKTLIELARKEGTDTRFFLPPLKCYEDDVHLSTQLYKFLRLLPSEGIDECTRFYTDTTLGKTPPTIEVETEFEDEDDDVELTSEILSPRKVDLSPPAQSLASLTYSTLNVMWHFTMRGPQREDFIYTYDGLQLLTRVWYVFNSDEAIMCKLASILLNLTVDERYHHLLVSGGFLHMLSVWINSLNPQLRSTAATALANLSKESSYHSGLYLLHPLYKQTGTPELDLVFIHGVHGAAFRTWRQGDTMKGSDEYSRCWPMDWLGEVFSSKIRTLGVTYTSSATYWESQCPYKLSIEDQAVALADKLLSCQTGSTGRKVLWVGHSLGGLIIKKILTLAKENVKYASLLDSTKGVVFMGVPHRGCPVARLSTKTSYIANPSIELQQIADSQTLIQLNDEFVQLAKSKEIICKNFLEGARTQLTSKIKVHIVPPEYAELETGENIVLEDENHVTICKPKDRDSRLFNILVDTITCILNPSYDTDHSDSIRELSPFHNSSPM